MTDSSIARDFGSNERNSEISRPSAAGRRGEAPRTAVSNRPPVHAGAALQPRWRSATDSTARTIGEELTVNLKIAGFSHCRLAMRRTETVPVAFAIAVK